MKTIAVYNFKGGVGKTATAINIAYLASQNGYKTLLWDLDPQGASSWYLNAQHDRKVTSKKILKNNHLPCKLIHKTSYENLDIVPSSLSFRHFDTMLDKMNSNDALTKVLQPYHENYSLVILDCPPGISRLIENVFTAMDTVLMPMVPTWLSLHSYDQLKGFLKENNHSRKGIYPFFSMVDNRKKLHQDWLMVPPAQLKRLMRTYIPYSSAVEKMGEFRAPIEVFAANTSAAASFRVLWKELNSKIKIQ